MVVLESCLGSKEAAWIESARRGRSVAYTANGILMRAFEVFSLSNETESQDKDTGILRRSVRVCANKYIDGSKRKMAFA